MSDLSPAEIEWFESLDPDMPVKWYDKQGSQIVKKLQKQFKGLEAFRRGLPVKCGGVWQCGSAITVYGAADPDLRRDITAAVRRHVIHAHFAPVRIAFFRGPFAAEPQAAIETVITGVTKETKQVFIPDGF